MTDSAAEVGFGDGTSTDVPLTSGSKLDDATNSTSQVPHSPTRSSSTSSHTVDNAQRAIRASESDHVESNKGTHGSYNLGPYNQPSSLPSPQQYNQYQQLSQPPPPTQYYRAYHYNDYEREDGISTMQAAALFTIGSFLGLTAAAAYRWLNGDDFTLLPSLPVTSDSSSANDKDADAEDRGDGIDSSESPQLRLKESRHNERYTHATDVSLSPNGKFRDNRERRRSEYDISDQISRLVDAIHDQNKTQERMMQKIVTANSGSSVSDQSMNLLRGAKRKNDSATDSQVSVTDMMSVVQLAEIKSALVTLQQQKQAEVASSTTEVKDSLTIQIQKQLDQLGTVLDKLQTRIDRQAAVCDADPQTDGSSNNGATSTALPARRLTSIAESDRSAQASDLVKAAVELLVTNDSKDLRVGAQLLYLYVVNLSTHQHVPRYRKIYTNNESFAKVNKLQGGCELLYAVGFVEKDKMLEWSPFQLGPDDERDEQSMEEYYLMQLQKAATALGVLKSHSPNQEPSEMLRLAIDVIDRLCAEQEYSGNDKGESNTNDDDSQQIDASEDIDTTKQYSVPNTPSAGFVKSPPMMKKMLLPPSSSDKDTTADTMTRVVDMDDVDTIDEVKRQLRITDSADDDDEA